MILWIHRADFFRFQKLSFFERNWVFVTNTNCLIPKFLQPDCIHLWYFKPMHTWIYSLTYQRSTKSGCKDKGIIKSEFLAKNSTPLYLNLFVQGFSLTPTQTVLQSREDQFQENYFLFWKLSIFCNTESETLHQTLIF